MSMILSYLSSQMTTDDLEKGYQVHRHILVKYFVLFGPIEVEPPICRTATINRGIVQSKTN